MSKNLRAILIPARSGKSEVVKALKGVESKKPLYVIDVDALAETIEEVKKAKLGATKIDEDLMILPALKKKIAEIAKDFSKHRIVLVCSSLKIVRHLEIAEKHILSIVPSLDSLRERIRAHKDNIDLIDVIITTCHKIKENMKVVATSDSLAVTVTLVKIFLKLAL